MDFTYLIICKPSMHIHVEGGHHESDPAWYGALGFCRQFLRDKVPLFSGIRQAGSAQKSWSAMAATGAVALYQVHGITPEARIFSYPTEGLDEV
jgi:predicted aconitase